MLYQIELWVFAMLAINMLVAVSAISTFRFLMGLLAGVDTTHELSQKDNYAFGTVFAGGAIALGLVLCAAVEGDACLPAIERSAWRAVSRELHAPSETNPYPYSFVVLDRR